MDNTEMSVIEHLQELRKRLIISFASIFIASVILYQKILLLIEIFMRPVEELKFDLVYFSLIEGFMTRFKVSLLAGIILVSPIIFYQIGAFIFPGLTSKEKKILNYMAFYLSAFFIGGTFIGYFLVLPHVLNFLISYSTSYMNPILSGSMYLSFIGIFCIVMGIVCTMPLVFLFLAKQQVVSVKTLMKWRKYVVAIAIALELCFVPSSDAITFIAIVFPIIILYELSLWILYFKEKRRKKRESV
ncbi:twin-arginine translocase subunit TatC [Clostridium sp. CX1]|uniref:twin-arginine translocase subunit TatC n=1 Tax=Clostridium sp. CX1 TaxID=2978346 RepID=UPI0021BDF60C|nr:twin-arginine translocase subunit TatC [Clostridium sp. CX1]MCT8976682.1 twin-arginine translocase subunit TatC [Clostridium sp. CX1]